MMKKTRAPRKTSMFLGLTKSGTIRKNAKPSLFKTPKISKSKRI